jgi:hypothetical protein
MSIRVTRRIIALATVLVFALGVLPVRAHEAFRFVGTVAKVQGTQLGVKLKIGRTIWVELKKSTIILKDKTKVPASALKPGLSVVVDALGDDDSDLEAKQVRIVPAIVSQPSKGTPRQ